LKSSGLWVLVAAILGSSMVFIDGTVVNVALPALQVGLRATIADVQWVVEAYALFLAALLLVGGSLGDLYGRRRIFLLGTILFAGASVWCGLAPDIHHLIVARSLQGIGGALLVPGSLALISTAFAAEERGRAIGTWSGFTAMTASVGPVLGGWLVQHASWRWVFFVNVPMAIVVVLVCVFGVAKDHLEGDLRATLDGFGAILATVGLGGIIFALIEWSRGGRAAVAAGVIGFLALLAFIFVEKRSCAPMIPFELFRSRNFSGANLLTLFLYAGLSGLLFFFPLDLIQVQHYSATQAGAALLPLILLIFVLSRWSGGLVARYGARPPLIVGPLVASLGFALFALPPLGHTYWGMFFVPVLVLGLGMSISVAPLTTVVMGALPQNRVGIGSGVNNAVSRVASLLAVAVCGLLMSALFNSSLDRRLEQLALTPSARSQVDAQRPQLAAIVTDDPAVRAAVDSAFTDGYRAIQWLAATLAALSALIAALVIRSAGGKNETSENRGGTWRQSS
jgi:EmrB/QacA subfamily drug resistance transporter